MNPSSARWDGNAWAIDTRATGASTDNLSGVWANGPSDGWAVGNAGTIVHLGP